MEHASNFMMGGGMMPQNHMQRPQPGNEQQQIYAKVMEELIKSRPNNGWQAIVSPNERAPLIMQLVTSLRLLNNDLGACLRIALQFEQRAFMESPSKEHWQAQIKGKLGEVASARQQKAASMMQRANNLQAGQPGMAPQTPMQPSRSNQGQIDMSNGFPQHLQQQQMQSSPMNMPPQNMAMQMDNHGMQGMQNMQGGMPQQNQPPRPNPPGLTAEEHNQVRALAEGLLKNMPQEQAQNMRQKLFSAMQPQQRDNVIKSGQDPLARHLYQQALNKMVKQKTMQHGQVPGAQMNQAGMMSAQAPNANMQRPPSQAAMPAGNMMPGQDIDFSSFAGQQADAMKMQGAGELVVPASNNVNLDQAMGNMGPMNMGQGQMPQQAMNNPAYAAMLRQQQIAREQMMVRTQAMQQAQQARNAANAAQAAQAQMLRGQPGGLNANQAAQQSPAMSMLNRPMVPPGQQGSATPQQRPQQPNQMNPQMMAQAPQAGMNPGQGGMFPMQNPNLQNLPPQFRQRMANMSDDQVRQFLQNLQRQQSQKMQPSGPPQGFPEGVSGPDAMNGMQGFPTGMPGGPQPNSGQPLNPNAQLHQKLALQQQRLREMDAKPFPPKMVQELQCQIPQHITTWGQLKEFIGQNQANLQSGLLEKTRRLQQAIFRGNLGPPGQNANGQPVAPAQTMGPSVPQQASMAGGQAPPAPMGQRQAVPPNQNRPQINFEPTPQEIQVFRQKMVAQGQNPTDELVKQTVRRWKIQRYQQEQQRNNQLRQAQMGPGGRPDQSIQAQATQQAQQMSRPPAQMMPKQAQPAMGAMPQADQGGQKRPRADEVIEISNPNQSPQRATPTAGQPPRQLPRFTPEQLAAMTPEQKAQLHQRMQQQQMQVRAQREALRRAQSQTGQHQSGEQPSQNVKPQQNPQQLKQKIQAMKDQISARYKKGNPIALDQNSLNQALESLKEIGGYVPKMEQSFGVAVGWFGERNVQQMIVTLVKWEHEMNRDGTIRDYISLPLTEIENMKVQVNKYMAALMNFVKAAQNKQAQGKPQQPSPNQQQTAQQQPPQNMQQQAAPNMARTSSAQQERRSTSKPPAAPTSAAPPFSFGAPSPHGVPHYEVSTTGFTQDKLHLPPQKKRKPNATGSAASTPVNQGTTPGSIASPQLHAGKMPSPEQRRHLQIKSEPQPPKEPEKRFKCDEDMCEFSLKGFEKEEELQAHKEEAHKPIENPLQFLIESAADAFNVDLDGNPKPPKVDPNAAKGGKGKAVAAKAQLLGSAAVKKETLKTEGQTPKVKQEATTPTPNAGLNTAALQKTPSGKQGQQPAPVVDETPRKRTMREVLAEKAGIPLPPTNEEKGKEGRKNAAPEAMDESIAFMDSVRNTLLEGDGLGPEFDYDLLLQPHDLNTREDGSVEWVLRPEVLSPITTPSDQSSSSEQSTSTSASSISDVNDMDKLKIVASWDPFGLGGTNADNLFDELGMGDLGLNGSFTGLGKNQDGKKEDAGIDAKPDAPPKSFDWDSVFGPNAGLDNDPMDWDKDAFGNSVLEGFEF